jgi:hypothetical protein
VKKSILNKLNNNNNITLVKNTIDNKSIENSRLANLLSTKETLLLKPLEQKKELSDNISNIYDNKLPDFTERLPNLGDLLLLLLIHALLTIIFLHYGF